MKKLIYIPIFLFCLFSEAQSNKVEWFLEISRQQANVVTGDAIEVLNPLFYYNPSTIDVDAISDGDALSGANVWTDASGNGYDLTIGTGTFELNIQTGVGRQVRWTSSAYLDVPSASELDLVPGTDEFTIVYRIGEGINPTGSGYPLAKAPSSTSLRTGPFFSAAQTYSGFFVGGSTSSFSDSSAPANHLLIAVISTTSLDVWIDGVQVITGGTVGTGDPTGQSWNIGGRTDGSYLAGTGFTMDLVALIPKAINSTERAAIETEFQIN